VISRRAKQHEIDTMKLKRLTALLSLVCFICLLSITSCVSVSLRTPKTKRSTGVRFNELPAPFQREPLSDVDVAWKNRDNGNMISFLSECQDQSDPSLDGIVSSALEGLTDLRIEAKESPTIQGREARRVEASGKVDGVSTKIDLLVFKRDSCIYILTYGGVKTAFDANRQDFNRFVEGFRAP
jgi:hypothetical protein